MMRVQGNLVLCVNRFVKKDQVQKMLSRWQLIQNAIKPLNQSLNPFRKTIEQIKSGSQKKQQQLWMSMRKPQTIQTQMNFLMNSIQFYELRFKDKHFIQFKRVQLGSYAGKLSIIIRMKDDKGAQYVYYNLVTSSHKYRKAFGENIEFAQLKYIDKQVNKNQITVVMRFLPINFNSEKLEALQNIRSEELFTYQGLKYGIFKTSDYEIAGNIKKKILSYFQNKKYNDIHITIKAKKKSTKEKVKVFLEEESYNPRSQLEQKIGIPLSPIKVPPLVVKEIEQPKIKPTVLQPTICAIQITVPQVQVNQIKPVEIKPTIIEQSEQKVIVRAVQLKPVTLTVDRERSSRKK
ncbi:unnamed protein product [Paramecium primaurelia]|uniref:Uncharacterized protein n=1 Tax=Paramecium primaurelia TaxID=5886 RepID=A0A8S1KVW4_PARPR|nr:unnamed protein product [Paramecium primaurelia]